MSSDAQIAKLVEDIVSEKSSDETLVEAFGGMSAEVKEATLRQYLIRVAEIIHRNKVHSMLQVLNKLVGLNLLPPRMLCEQIMSSEKLVFQNQSFWIECFQVVRKIIGGVDYKGVREIMKCCKEKALSFPSAIGSNILPQMQELTEVIEHIFNRNACLLPAYFIINEIQKADYQDTHWRIANLIANFIEEFVIVAQMLSIIGHSHLLPIVEHSSYADNLINPWKLDPNTLKLALRGNLPYEPELLQPQKKLLRFVLEQPYSRDMVCSMLNLQKQQKQKCMALEEQLVWLVICAMECSEKEPAHPADGEDMISSHTQWVWLHLSSQLIYFVLFQFATFQNIVNALHDKLAVRNLRRGRDQLMWVLLQYISGSIQRNSITNFLPILKLYDILYPEKEPLPVPDYNNPFCTHQMAPTCIWIHLLKRAQSEHYNINRPIPIALKLHHEFLQHLLPNNNATLCMGSDYRIALLCNAYSTNQDYFSRPMAALIETILGNSKNQTGAGGAQQLPTVPLSMCVLDSLTIHSKMSLIHSIVTHMIKQAQNKSTIPNANNMAPALVETYSRLLVYTEIESLGIKGFLSQLLPQVFKSHAWGILYTLLEMFSYRMHHIQPHYRVQLLSHLHSLASVPHTNQMQLHSCVESTALRLITGLGSVEVQAQLSRYVNEPKAPGNIVSAESEELNRALILTLARSMQITGTGNDPQSTWCKDLLTSIMTNTPHTWSQHTLQCFPPVLNDFFVQNSIPKENKQLLKKSVDEEYRNWAGMSNENDIISHFGAAGTPPLFLCLLFKMIVETDTISPVAYKTLERIGARALSAHLRKLCDYLVFEVSNSGVGAHVNKCVDTINDMIWKYNILTIDRLVLCLSLRTLEGNEAQVSFCIIQLLLLKTSEFRNRLQEFVNNNSPEHWKQNNWHERHLAFHQKFPEKFAPDESVSHPAASLPVYFGNVCLRFLPVLDITIHRYLEVPATMSKTLDVLLDHLGSLYKFHDRPITYLYNTLHYYERRLRERPHLKKRLVGTVIGSLKDVRPDHWAVTEQYQAYMLKKDETVNWLPELNYYIGLVRRMQDTIDGNNVFQGTDWRFNEFPNPPAHALYVSCVELLGLPVGPQAVANSLIDVVVKGYPVIPINSVHNWINTIGLLMAALPESYWSVIYDRLKDVISSVQMTDWTHRQSPFELFNFKIVKEAMLEKNYVVILAIAQSILHHSGIGQISTITDFIKEKFKPIIKTEYQLIYLCHVVGPFLNRLSTERPRAVSDITLILYELLEQVDKAQPSAPLKYMDPICDLLYHIKYMFVGDMMKSDLEAIIRRLRPALQMRLRFITRLNVDEIGVEQQATEGANGPASQSQPEFKPQVGQTVPGGGGATVQQPTQQSQPQAVQ